MEVRVVDGGDARKGRIRRGKERNRGRERLVKWGSEGGSVSLAGGTDG